MTNTRIYTYLTAIVLCLFDQLSKWYLLDLVLSAERQFIKVTSFFNLVMVWNKGVSFGMFSGFDARWMLIGVAIILSAVIWFWDRKHTMRWQHIASGLIIGGAIGNVIDRFRFGAVADFFDVHIAGYHWPAFNIADTGIVVGVLMLLCTELFFAKVATKKGESYKESRPDSDHLSS